MPHEIDLKRAQKHEARWRILRILDACRPSGGSESLIWRALTDIDLPFTPREVRRELDYLRDGKLITLKNEHTENMVAELTYLGVNVVEYEVACPDGITRPPKV